jgi:DNA-binding IclR family transcriptional regulator
VSIGTERRLRAELAQIQDRGIAFDREESARGLTCVAAPVGTPGAPVAAISVCGPVNQVNTETLIRPLRATARTVWNSFSAGRTAPPSTLREAGWLRQIVGA